MIFFDFEPTLENLIKWMQLNKYNKTEAFLEWVFELIYLLGETAFNAIKQLISNIKILFKPTDTKTQRVFQDIENMEYEEFYKKYNTPTTGKKEDVIANPPIRGNLPFDDYIVSDPVVIKPPDRQVGGRYDVDTTITRPPSNTNIKTGGGARRKTEVKIINRSVTSTIDYRRAIAVLLGSKTNTKIEYTNSSYLGNIIEEANAGYVPINGRSIHRIIETSPVSSVEYKEYLTIVKGNHTILNPRGEVENYKGYITTNKMAHTDNSTNRLVIKDWILGYSSFIMEINYETYLKFIRDTFSRGIFRLKLVQLDDNGNIVNKYLILEESDNVGDRKNPKDGINFRDGKRIVKEFKDLPYGRYQIIAEFEDTYEDLNVDRDGFIPYGAYDFSIFYPKFEPIEEPDDTKVRFTVVDEESGAVIRDEWIEEASHLPINIEVPPNKRYRISYELNKNETSIGGVLGIGGYFIVDGGEFTETWQEKDYSDVKGSSYINPIDYYTEEIDSEEVIDSENRERWFWLDVIQLSNLAMDGVEEAIEQLKCQLEGIKVSVFNAKGEFIEEQFFDDGLIDFKFNNYTGLTQDFTFEMSVVGDCLGGYFEFYDGFIGLTYNPINNPSNDSDFSICLDKISLKSPIICGGCNGSSIEVNVYGNDTLLHSERIVASSVKNFEFDSSLFSGINDFNIEFKTNAISLSGICQDLGKHLFYINDVVLDARYTLSPLNYDSSVDFYINDNLIDTYPKGIGSPDDGIEQNVVKYPVPKGLNKFKWLFRTTFDDFNWDYVEIDWIKLSNWVCDDVVAIPYNEPRGGDRCIEELIGCLLSLLPKPTPKGCVVIRHVDYDSGIVLKQEKLTGFKEGIHTFNALDMLDYTVVGESSKDVYIDESGVCAEIEFYYKRLYRDCVYVLHIDNLGNVLLKEEFKALLPGIYKFYAKDFDGYIYEGESSKSIEINYLNEPPIDCNRIIFEYELALVPDPYKDCVYVIHREKGNPANVLMTETYYDLAPNVYTFYAKEFEGYIMEDAEEQQLIIEEITEPVIECKIIIFEYRKLKSDCIVVKYVDKLTGDILDTDFYWELLPGEYSFSYKEFEGYQLIGDEIQTILIEEDNIGDECKQVIFEYEPALHGCVIGKKIWILT